MENYYYFGLFYDGKKIGFGKFITPKYIFSGTYKDDKRHGIFKFEHKNYDIQFYGKFEHGNADGEGIII